MSTKASIICEICDSDEPLRAGVCLPCWNSLVKEKLEKDAALREAQADAESWYEQCEDARDALIRNGREAEAREQEKDAALGALAAKLAVATGLLNEILGEEKP